MFPNTNCTLRARNAITAETCSCVCIFRSSILCAFSVNKHVFDASCVRVSVCECGCNVVFRAWLFAQYQHVRFRRTNRGLLNDTDTHTLHSVVFRDVYTSNPILFSTVDCVSEPTVAAEHSLIAISTSDILPIKIRAHIRCVCVCMCVSTMRLS